MLKTTLAGSLPKPAWLADPGHQLFAPWVQPPDRLLEAQDNAVRLAISDQEDAGLDIVTCYSYGIPRVLATHANCKVEISAIAVAHPTPRAKPRTRRKGAKP